MMVPGGSVTTMDFLRENHEWDSKTPITDSSWVIGGGIKTLSWPAKNMWTGAEANLNLLIHLDDLGIFEFQARPNKRSFLLDKEDLTVGLYEGKTLVGWEKAEGRGVAGLAARAEQSGQGTPRKNEQVYFNDIKQFVTSF